MWHTEEPECTEVINGYYESGTVIEFVEDEDGNELDEYISKPYIITYFGLDKERHVGDQVAVYYDGEWWWFEDEVGMKIVRVPVLAWAELPEVYDGDDIPEWM